MAHIRGTSTVESAQRALDVRLTPGARLRRWPFFAAVALMLGVLTVGLTLYQGAPDPMPVHWNLLLQADAWAPKNLIGFLAPAFIGLGVTAVFWVIAALIPLSARLGSEKHPSGVQLTPRTRFNDANEGDVVRMLEHLSLSASALIGATAVASWLGVPEWLAPWLMPVLLLGFFGLLFVDIWRIMRPARYTV